MKIGTSLQKRIIVCAAMVCLMAPLAQARRTVKEKKQAALAQYETAERLRAALERKPESRRTREDYENLLDAYRKVYHVAPNSIKADTSILTVAQLLDEQGRVLHDPKSYSDSIGQLVFLRREYPGSKHRVAALFTIGEIYRDDLHDPVQAKATFEDYLKHYPNSNLASDARDALAELNAAGNRDPFKRKPAKAPRDVDAKAAWAEVPALRREQKTDSPQSAKANADDDAAISVATRATPKRDQAGDAAAKTPSSSDTASDATLPSPQPVDLPADKSDAQKQPRRIAHMTGIRHWSTPDYTRVAIDLGEEVEYQSGRVPHPDRIFFDLHNTKLSPELIGKSFDVGSGFLHRVRVAQYSANMARVVLDVDDVAEYSAFLLPNPYRLIIDIHGKLPPQQIASADRKPAAPSSETTPSDKMGSAPAKTGDAAAADSDVTVTHIMPAAEAKSHDSTMSAIDRAERAPAGPLKKRDNKPRETRTQDTTSADSQPPPAGGGTETARTEPRKIASDDAAAEDTASATTPTSGPTYQPVAPEETSRRQKRTASISPRRPAPGVASSRVADPTMSGDRSLIRALGLKIGKIVIDAGHGGHDTGTIGPNGLMEKDLVLDVALKLGKLLEARLGAEVVYTRDDDTFIPLETRTAIANKEQADLFISVHANSSSDATARGVETYYLNFTSSRDALEVAARENAVSEKSIHELQDLVKKIALKEKIEESRELATDVQKSLYAGLSAKSPAIHNRGVKKAPFIVLIGANMPSILAEISFVSNPTDERKLKTGEYRQRVAESLYKGVKKYVSGLSGVRVASQADEPGGKSSPALAAR